MTQTIEQKVASAILERNVSEIEIEGKVYGIAPPSIATLILVSEIISTLPIVKGGVPKDKILYSVLHYAKSFRPLGDLAATLILGARGLTEERVKEIEETRLYGLIRRKKRIMETVDKKAELSKLILENVRPSVLFDCIVRRLDDMEVGDFFAITTSLSEVNILKPTKEVVKV